MREVHKDGYTDKDIIIIEDKESAINLTEEERHGLNKMKDHINRDTTINTTLPRVHKILNNPIYTGEFPYPPIIAVILEID